MSIQAKVAEFHRMFGQPVLDSPAVPPDDRVRLRLKLICEEFFELLESTLSECEITLPPTDGGVRVQINSNGVRAIVGRLIGESRINVDLVQTADALADLAYVVYGTACETGFDLDKVIDEVHVSNLSKTGGGLLPNGKVRKGPNFHAPDIEARLLEQGWKR